MNKITKNLLGDIRLLIETTRERVSQTINSGLVLLYWSIGKRIREDILREKRAAYGKQILQTLSAKLGWSHFVELIQIQDSLKRNFYAEICRIEQWSVRTLREKSGIRVAEYMTELPPRKLLEKKFHQAIRLAREKFAVR